MLEAMSSAESRRAARTAWTSLVFRGADVHAAIEADAFAEWSAMTPLERLALSWQLSLEQYGADDGTTVEPRLPRSAYRIERR